LRIDPTSVFGVSERVALSLPATDLISCALCLLVLVLFLFHRAVKADFVSAHPPDFALKTFGIHRVAFGWLLFAENHR